MPGGIDAQEIGDLFSASAWPSGPGALISPTPIHLPTHPPAHPPLLRPAPPCPAPLLPADAIRALGGAEWDPSYFVYKDPAYYSICIVDLTVSHGAASTALPQPRASCSPLARAYTYLLTYKGLHAAE